MIEIINRQKRHKLDAAHFERLLGRLLRHYRLRRTDVTLAFAGNAEIRRLNGKFRKKDKETDVLSFPMNEETPEGTFYLGDIIISVPKAAEQSAALSHSLDRELEFLIIHGFLHLLGFEHDDGHTLEAEEEKMRARLLGDT
jgi:probable rRNA maturation factor